MALRSLIFLFLVSSCGLIQLNGNFKGLTSYYENSVSECPELFLINDSIASHYSGHKVFITNGKTLKNSILSIEKVIVYIWAPKCKSQFCPSPAFLREKCRVNGQRLFIVAEYYDCNTMGHFVQDTTPIFGIDIHYYKSNFTDKYLKQFLFDLTDSAGMELSEERLLYFEKGNFKYKTTSI